MGTFREKRQAGNSDYKAWGCDSSPIGINGIGKIGAEIARRVAASDYKLVLCNRSQEKADALATEIGAGVAATPAKLVQSCDLVLNIVSDWAAVQDIYTNQQGLLSACTQDSVFVELSTLGPTLIGQLEEQVSDAGASLIDASITGRPIDIAKGHGLIMAGGTETNVDRLAPILSAVGEVRHTGAVGTGATMKLVTNLMVFSTLCGISEALNVAENSGISREMAYELLIKSPVNSKVLEFRRGEFLEPEHASVQAALSLVTKDLDLIAGLAERHSTLIPQTLRVKQIFDAAEKAGYGPRDATAVAEFLRSAAAGTLTKME